MREPGNEAATTTTTSHGNCFYGYLMDWVTFTNELSSHCFQWGSWSESQPIRRQLRHGRDMYRSVSVWRRQRAQDSQRCNAKIFSLKTFSHEAPASSLNTISCVTLIMHKSRKLVWFWVCTHLFEQFHLHRDAQVSVWRLQWTKITETLSRALIFSSARLTWRNMAPFISDQWKRLTD